MILSKNLPKNLTSKATRLTAAAQLGVLNFIMNKVICVILVFLSFSSYSADRIFVGTYTEGFEWSYFIECGSSERAWIEYDPAVLELKKALEEDGISFSYRLGDKNLMIPVKLKGQLSKEGNWGHLGQYRYQLNVTQYISHGSVAEAECII